MTKKEADTINLEELTVEEVELLEVDTDLENYLSTLKIKDVDFSDLQLIEDTDNTTTENLTLEELQNKFTEDLIEYIENNLKHTIFRRKCIYNSLQKLKKLKEKNTYTYIKKDIEFMKKELKLEDKEIKDYKNRLKQLKEKKKVFL